MSRNLVTLSAAATLLGGAALAEVPRVAADIAPVHSLVARVMLGVGAPDMIVAPGANPHEYSLRPSEAAALQDADLVFWVSPDLTPWLGNAIETLAGKASVTELLEAGGMTVLPFRDGALFGANAHGEEDHADGGDDHQGHRDHDHKEHANEKSQDDHAGHDHDGHDPHAWLSPENGAIWLNVIAAKLSVADPDNAGAYLANAAEGRRELAALSAEIDGILDPVRGRNFIVFHDAYQYFERAFDFPASGAIALSDASDPSPARIAGIQARVAAADAACVLSEPQFDPGLVATVMGGSGARTGVLDPLGSDLDPGPELYGNLLRNLATALAGCLSR